MSLKRIIVIDNINIVYNEEENEEEEPNFSLVVNNEDIDEEMV